MIIGRVIGRAVATRKDEKLLGTKLLLVEELDPAGVSSGDLAVVADHIGAGAGDVVLISQGSAARLTGPTEDRPVDALVVGIVDTIRLDGRNSFTKAGGFARRRVRKIP